MRTTAKALNIEARTMIDMASKQIIPAVIKYTRESGRDNQRSRNRLAQRLRYRWNC